MRISDWSSDVCSSDLLSARNTRRKQNTRTIYSDRVQQFSAAGKDLAITGWPGWLTATVAAVIRCTAYRGPRRGGYQQIYSCRRISATMGSGIDTTEMDDFLVPNLHKSALSAFSLF